MKLGEAGRDAEAVAELRKALESDPGLTEAHFMLGRGLSRLERPAEAAEEYRIFLSAGRDHPDARHELGRALFELGRGEEAATEIERAIRLDPGVSEYHYHLGKVLNELDRHVEAVRAFQEAVKRGPEDADAHAGLACSLWATGRTDEAIWHFYESIRREREPWVLLRLGMLLAAVGRPAEAEEILREVLVLEPKDVEAMEQLAMVLSDLDREDEASALLENAAAVEPTSARIGAMRINFLLDAKLDEAENLALELLLNSPSDLYARLAMAWVQVARGKARDAIDTFDRIREDWPTEASVHGGLGVALLAIGDREGAALAFAEARRLEPSFFAARTRYRTAYEQAFGTQAGDPTEPPAGTL